MPCHAPRLANFACRKSCTQNLRRASWARCMHVFIIFLWLWAAKAAIVATSADQPPKRHLVWKHWFIFYLTRDPFCGHVSLKNGASQKDLQRKTCDSRKKTAMARKLFWKGVSLINAVCELRRLETWKSIGIFFGWSSSARIGQNQNRIGDFT